MIRRFLANHFPPSGRGGGGGGDAAAIYASLSDTGLAWVAQLQRFFMNLSVSANGVEVDLLDSGTVLVHGTQ